MSQEALECPWNSVKSLQLKHKIPLHLPCSRDLRAAGNESLIFCLFVFGSWQSRFFSCLQKDYMVMVIRGNPPQNYYIMEHKFSNKPLRQRQRITKISADENPPQATLEDSHKSSSTLSQSVTFYKCLSWEYANSPHF